MFEISAVLSLPLKADIGNGYCFLAAFPRIVYPPRVICWTIWGTERDGASSSGPILPFECAAANIWQAPHPADVKCVCPRPAFGSGVAAFPAIAPVVRSATGPTTPRRNVVRRA